MPTLSARFVRALRALENDLDLQPLVQLYAEDCELTNPLIKDPLLGTEGARRYWRMYLDRFQEIRTEFKCLLDCQQGSALEWISSATVSDGRPLEFGGVTLLLIKDTRIRSMHVYFDPQPLAQVPARKEPTPIRASLDDAKTA